MKSHYLPCAATLLLAWFPPAIAQRVAAPSAVPEVVVSANPLGSGLFELAVPVSILESPELQLRGASTLGETIGNMPGVSSSYFGPGASRPIIRGLDGDRIRILQGSVGTLDASGLSFDHAVPTDAMAVTRIEVVRGAAALLYGGNAVGGVVNVLTNRIPEAAIHGIQGALEARAGGALTERSAATLIEVGNGKFALHADGFWRETADLKIPGLARSPRQRELDAINNPAQVQPNGRVPNSAARANGGAFGGSLTWDRGYLGASYTNHQTTYGSPLEAGVKINMHSDRYDLAGELRNPGGFIRSVKFKGAFTDYAHRELDRGQVGTSFFNKGYETRLEASHAALAGIKGVFGVQLGNARFSALGDEAFVPSTLTSSSAVYLYEELPLGALKLSFGARHESTSVTASGDQSIESFADPLAPVARFAQQESRRFKGNSGAIGAVYNLGGRWALSANLAHTERAPTFYELFANGPHAATGTYELGSAAFGLEKSNSLDAGVKWRGGPHSAGLSVYTTRFSNYLALFNTGARRGGDGAFEDPLTPGTSTTGSDELSNEAVYRAIPARFSGFEAEARLRLTERPGTLYLELKSDLVRATNLQSGQGLPRIAPRRFAVALNYAVDRHNLRVELNHSAAQNRVPTGESTSAGHTLLNLYASTRLNLGGGRVLAWVRGTNLTNQEARLASSFLRDIVPLGARALHAGVRLDF